MQNASVFGERSGIRLDKEASIDLIMKSIALLLPVDHSKS